MAPATSISHAAGLESVDGELLGVGDGYKVSLTQRGFEFTPALGALAPRNYPIAFELLSVARDGAAIPMTSSVPRPEGLRVEYDRGTVVERYDVRADHLAQSFVFRARPAGRGDLVVRGRLTTELDVSADGDGLRFTLPDVGACTMSGVTGIDAAGRRAVGRVHYAQGVVELSLPAAFVDSAALPFVLDPLLAGASVISGTGGGDDRNPTVAYDAGNDVYCVAWERVFSATDHDVYAQRVNRTGVPVGPLLFLETSFALTTDPRIANGAARGAFVVVYSRGIDILGRAVDAATGLLGAAAVIAGGTGSRTESHSSGCVASNLTTGQLLCTWQRNTSTPTSDHIMQAASVAVGQTLALSVGPIRDVARGTALSRPRLGKSDRGRNRHAVVYQRSTGSVLLAVIKVIDGSGAALSGELTLSTSPSAAPEPEVDGDGTTWVAAWQPANVVPTDHLECASVSFDAASGQVVVNGRGTVSPGLVDDFVAPRVTWIADSCLLAYAEQGGGLSAARVGSLDPFACTTCEAHVFAGVNTRVEGSPSGWAVQASGGTGEDALLAWEQVLAGNGDIIARRWLAVDGEVTSLGGGCGRGGSNTAPCPRSPNFRFAHRLRDALGLAPTVFILSAGQASLPCDSCNLIPDLTAAISLVTATDLGGDASVAVSIPGASPLVGVPMFTQWATIDLNAPACRRFLLHLSNALRVVVQS